MNTFQETKATIHRTILIRRISLGIFCLVAMSVVLTSEISPLNPLFAVPFSWLVLTVAFEWVIRRQRDLSSLHRVHAGFLAAEALLLGWLVHRMGGTQWIGVVFYLYTVMYANFFLPKRAGYLVTGIAVGTYAAVAFLEYFGILPHITLFETDNPLHRHLPYVITTVVVGGIGLYATLAFTVRAFAGIHERQKRELRAREQGLSRLSARLLTAQEDERRRIAGKLHDELGQLLVAARWSLATGATEEAELLLLQAVEGTRDLARDLRPPLLDDLGLGPALRHWGEKLAEGGGPSVDVDVQEGRVPEPCQTAVFRTVQEAMENAARHARARHVSVSLVREGDMLSGSVTDDGIGFRTGSATEGLGLPGMREWIGLAGGELHITSTPGRGTQVSFRIPLP